MPRLVLVRHAEAEDGDGDDFARRLTDHGRSQAGVVATKLGAAGVRADRIVTSPAPRALATAHLVAPGLGRAAADVREDMALYGAPGRDVLAAAQRHAAAAPALGPGGALAVVGHNTGISDLAVRLAGLERGWSLGKAHAVVLETDRAWNDVAAGTCRMVATFAPT
jgi:phosphohistidine phosphatase